MTARTAHGRYHLGEDSLAMRNYYSHDENSHSVKRITGTILCFMVLLKDIYILGLTNMEFETFSVIQSIALLAVVIVIMFMIFIGINTNGTL